MDTVSTRHNHRCKQKPRQMVQPVIMHSNGGFCPNQEGRSNSSRKQSCRLAAVDQTVALVITSHCDSRVPLTTANRRTPAGYNIRNEWNCMGMIPFWQQYLKHFSTSAASLFSSKLQGGPSVFVPQLQARWSKHVSQSCSSVSAFLCHTIHGRINHSRISCQQHLGICTSVKEPFNNCLAASFPSNH